MTTTYQPGDVVLMEFPFASGGGVKHRPALVLIDIGDADVLAARITTQETRDRFDVEIADWHAAGLRLPSIVRLHKLATLEKTIVGRKLGRLSASDWARVQQAIRQLWDSIAGNP